MSQIEPKLESLKEHLESAAFLVSNGESEKEAHSEIVQSFIIVAELKRMLNNHSAEPLHKRISRRPTEIEEIRKVNRRLKLWAGRQSQINSKILNAFLKLKRDGLTTVTEADLRNVLPEERSFYSNFAQMKIIAPNNHGKVFEQYGDNISIWEPVAVAVSEYEKVVFESR